MNNSDSYDAQNMFKHACAFCDCAYLCEVESSNIEYRFILHTVAGIVNSAFACEIFIKSLLRLHGKSFEEIKCFSHKLNDLWIEFKNVEEEAAILIEERLKEGFKLQDEDGFSRLLEDASNSFEHWRYIYEKENGRVNIQFLQIFRNLLRDTCCQKVLGKSWEEYKKDENK